MKRFASRRQSVKRRIWAALIDGSSRSRRRHLDMGARELLAADQGQVGVLEGLDLVARGQLLARAQADDLALGDEGDPVAELLGLLQVVGGEQDRRPLLVDALDVVPELEPQLDVYA